MRPLSRTFIAIASLCIAAHAAAGPDTVERVASPDGHIVLELAHKLDAGGKRNLSYNVRYDGDVVIRDSRLALRLDNHLNENAMALPVDRRRTGSCGFNERPCRWARPS